jgi:hypothetical protein
VTGPILDFFGCRIAVRCTEPDADDLRFFFGPHVLSPTDRGEPAGLRLDLVADSGFFRSLLAKDRAHKAFTLRGGDGAVLVHREFLDWSSVPSPLPPFRLLADRVCVVQATVLTRGGHTVALVGTPYSGKTSVGLAMARRGWVFVSDQLLVVERATGDVLPYCVPVGLRGATLVAMRAAGLVRGAVRATVSEVSGEVVLVRPETVSAPISASTRLREPVLVHVRRDDGGPTRLMEQPFERLERLRAWPNDALADLRGAVGHRTHAVLTLTANGSREQAAELVESHCG